MDGFFDFLGLHFAASEFDGRVQLGCRGRKSVAVKPALTCALSELRGRLEEFRFDPLTDYYLTANSFCGVRRVSEDLFSLHNLVIDIDCHGEGLFCELDFFLQCFVGRLEHSVFGVEMAIPSSIVYTGRGIQLWWAMEGISGRFLNFYKEVLDFYIHVLHQVTEGSLVEEFSCLTVDRTASRNVVGYFRCPFTFNTSANRRASVVSSGQRYELMFLFDWMKEVKANSPEEDWAQRREGVETEKMTFSQLSGKRVEWIYSLRDHRDKEIGEEQRNNLCFMLYNSVVIPSGHEFALRLVNRFNQGFKVPMTESELEATLSSAKSKGGYQYSQERFFQFLEISEEEALLLGGFQWEDSLRLNQKQVASLQAKTKKEERNQRILALFDGGSVATEIAKQMNLSMPTIAKVLKENQRSRQEYDKASFQKMVDSGMSCSEVAKKCGCSTRTVQRAVKTREQIASLEGEGV